MEPTLRPLPEPQKISPDLVFARMHLEQNNLAAARPFLYRHIEEHPHDEEASRLLLSLDQKIAKPVQQEITAPMMIVSLLWEILKGIVFWS